MFSYQQLAFSPFPYPELYFRDDWRTEYSVACKWKSKNKSQNSKMQIKNLIWVIFDFLFVVLTFEFW